MAEYDIIIYRGSDMSSEGEFWRFIRELGGSALSHPWLDDVLLGKAYLSSFSSNKPLTIEAISEEFPELGVTDLRSY